MIQSAPSADCLYFTLKSRQTSRYTMLRKRHKVGKSRRHVPAWGLILTTISSGASGKETSSISVALVSSDVVMRIRPPGNTDGLGPSKSGPEYSSMRIGEQGHLRQGD